MCGSAKFTHAPEDLRKLGVNKIVPMSIFSRSGISSGIILPSMDMTQAIFGLDLGYEHRLINARKESLGEKVYLSDTIPCIVPVSMFYEKQESYLESSRLPKGYWVKSDDDSILTLAGVCRQNYVGDTEYAIVTTKADLGIQNFHDRMPLIVESEVWLDNHKLFKAYQKDVKLLFKPVENKQYNY
jgi:putative SOS response-associated peptidase YedK